MTDRKADPVVTYDRQAGTLASRYESITAADVHAPLVDLVPSGPGLALDVGAGSGRDAAWLVLLGYQVVAVEPAAGMRREGRSRHPEQRIRWIDDRLPGLATIHRLGLSYDLILLSAVWMHIPPESRPRAFRKLITLLKPGGLLLLTLRHGPDEPDRPMWPTSVGEIETLARSHGVAVIRSVTGSDRLGRPEVSWTATCLKLPDEGTSALPLIRGIILNDEKSSTYKLALLRSIARIADGASSVAIEDAESDAVDVPLGLVALNWIRMYLPLVAARLPQAPRNAGPDGLGFAKEGFRALGRLGIAAQELRIGTQFAGNRARAVAKAMAEAKTTIATMPATFTTYPNSNKPVFLASPARARRMGAVGPLQIEAETLRAYGSLRVPGHIWRAMQRFGAWIEPLLVAEWSLKMRQYGERMGREISSGAAEEALIWIEPSRDTGLARQIARHLFDAGKPIFCVWTGRRLRQDTLDVDHCLPWSAWPCGDLWNLMPASSHVNQHLKRDRLPSATVLAAAQESIVSWWKQAWDANPALAKRFSREATAALPVPLHASMDEVFGGLEWRRLRLHQDQQLEEWPGIRSG